MSAWVDLSVNANPSGDNVTAYEFWGANGWGPSGTGVVFEECTLLHSSMSLTYRDTPLPDNQQRTYYTRAVNAIGPSLPEGPILKTTPSGSYVHNLSSSAPSIQIGLHSSRPSFGNMGAIYIESDTNAIFRDTGSAWVAAQAGSVSNPYFIGTLEVGSGTGQPSVNWPEGSLWIRTDEPQLWQQGVPAGSTPALVQSVVVDTNNTGTLGSTPTVGSYLIAVGFNWNALPTPHTDFVSYATYNASGTNPYATIAYKQVDSTSFSTSVTPFSNTGAGGYGVAIFEVSGLDPTNFAAAIQAITIAHSSGFGGGTNLTLSYTTTASNTLTLAACCNMEQGGGTTVETGLASPWIGIANSVGSGATNIQIASQFTATTSSSLSSTTTGNTHFGQPEGQTCFYISLNSPGAASWSLIGPGPTTIQSAGTTVRSDAKGLNFVGPLSVIDHPGTKILDIGITTPGDATKFLNGDTTPAYAQVKDSDLSTSDITTNNVSTSKHGFAPKAPNDATKYLDGTGAYSVPAGGGGSGALVKISQVTTAASQSSVTFSSIAGTYTDLIVVVSGRGDTSANQVNINVQFNSDTGANYDYQQSQINAGSTLGGAQSQAATSAFIGYLPAATATANVGGANTITIPSYAGTTFQKSFYSQGNLKVNTSAGAVYEDTAAGAWRSTSAINAIKVFTAAGNFVNGSVVTLYGMG